MATKTPADRAIADVEKAIKAHDVALEKADVAQKKADELTAKANRLDRELDWMAHHPDLPDDFDLDAFRRSLETPFDDDSGLDTPAPDPVQAAEEETPVDDVKAAPAEIGEADGDDDPWGDE